MAGATGGIEPGAELGGYRFVRILGQGGMATAYEAEQLSLRRRVAIKVISADLSNSDAFRARFVHEARLAASLDHPSVLPVHETGVLPDGRLFISMRLVDGVDLETRLRAEGRLTPSETAGLLVQVGDALDFAHTAGVIHRDVKPANVLLEQRPAGAHVWLADFGLAKRIEGATQHTKTGEVVGTVHYMAPEQIEGAKLTSRVDVYAFGCLAYRCLTGRVPFPRDSQPAALMAHLNAPAPLPSDAVPGVPQSLDTLVARAMEKDPARRASSAGALGRWAAAQLAGAPHPAAAAPTPAVDRRTPVEHAQKPSREARGAPPSPAAPPPPDPARESRRRGWLAPAAVSLACLLALGGVAALVVTSEEDPGPPRVSAQDRAVRALELTSGGVRVAADLGAAFRDLAQARSPEDQSEIQRNLDATETRVAMLRRLVDDRLAGSDQAGRSLTRAADGAGAAVAGLRDLALDPSAPESAQALQRVRSGYGTLLAQLRATVRAIEGVLRRADRLRPGDARSIRSIDRGILSADAQAGQALDRLDSRLGGSE